MKVLITGGAGFIGSHLADRLIDKGDEVIIMDNLTTGRIDNINSNAIFIEGDIFNDDLVTKTFEEYSPQIVVHAAASYKSPDDWHEDVKTNVFGTVNIVKNSIKHDVKKFIYFQTALCYGIMPIQQPITLTHPLFAGSYNGGSSYAISKTAGELYISLSGLNFISFRLANVYGPRNLSGPLPTFYSRIVNNQKCYVMDTRRDFLFIEDLIDLVSKALHENYTGYYHVSSGKDHSIKELFESLLTALHIKLPYEVEIKPRGLNDAYTILLDPEKTKKDFFWESLTPLYEGVEKAIIWYKNNSFFETYTHLKINEEER